MKPSLSVRYVLLGLLADGPRHGYEMHSAFQDSEGLGQIWRLGISQMYAELAKLEGEGLVRSSTELQPARPPKRVLALTRAGRQEFKRWMRSPARGLREMRVEFMARLFFARQAGPQAVAQLVQRQLESIQRELATIASENPSIEEHPDEFASQVARFRVGQLHAAIQWLETCKPAQSASRARSRAQA